MPSSSNPTRISRPKKNVNKAALACFTCRSKKVKCSGTVPCQYCSKRGLDCNITSQGQRRVYSVTHVEELQSRLAQYERGFGSNAEGNHPNANNNEPIVDPDITGITSPSPAAQIASPAQLAGLSNSSPLSVPSTRDGGPAGSLTGHSIIADSSLSSSNTFGSRVQGLINCARPSIPTPSRAPLSEPHARCERPPPRLPSEAEAHRLLETVNLYIGQTQNYFDMREVSDTLGTYYSSLDSDPSSPSSPQFLQLMLVLALGRLFVGDFSNAETSLASPGSDLFEFANKRLPPPNEQYSLGRVGVEILGLLAVYLQNVDKKVEAYIYISMALRLAVCHGYHQPLTTERMLPWEKVHIGRLWWTIYMQERRLAAATGHPFGISDKLIEIEFPGDAPGFNPSAPIRTNAKIARVTSRILRVIYGAKPKSPNETVADVKEIIESLHDISKDLPENVATMAAGSYPDLSVRTTASLQLMLYQATLLTIRPMMLHVAQILLTGQKPSSEELNNSTLGQLSRTCTEAARRLLSVVIALRKRNILAIFGFFDCDAIFSAAFVMILANIYDAACTADNKMNASPGLREALDSLQYLADNRNTFAIARLQEVQSIWAHLSEHYQLDEAVGIMPQQTNLPGTETSTGEQQTEGPQLRSHFSGEEAPAVSSTNGGETSLTQTGQDFTVRQQQQPVGHSNSVASGLQDVATGRFYGDVPEPQQPLTDLWADISQLCDLPLAEYDEGVQPADGDILAENGLPSLDKGFQGLLHGFDWDLMGHDIEDFAEFGRHIANLGS